MNNFKTLLLFFFLFTSSYAKMESVTLQLQWKNQFQFAGYYMAIEKGYYNDAYLDVKLLEYKQGSDTLKKVLSGEVNYAIGRSSLILQRANGKNIVLLSAILQSSPLAMVTKKSSEIDSIEKFKDKRFSITLNEANTSLYPILLSKNIDKNSVKVLTTSTKIKDLLANKTDIITLYTSNQEYSLIKKGIEYNIFYPKDYGFDFYDDILYTNEKETIHHKARTKNFVNASRLGWQYAFDNIEETVDLILSKYNTQNKTRDELLYEANTLKKLAFANGKNLGNIDKNKIQRIADMYHLMGLTNSIINQDNFIFNDTNNKIHLTKEEKSFLKKHKTIKVHNELNWPPYNFNIDGVPKGYSIDFMNLIAKKLDLQIQYIQGNSWSEFMKKFQNNEVDVMMNIVKNQQREKFMNFSSDYAISTKSIFTNDESINDLDDLKDKTISIQKDSFIHQYFKNNFPNEKLYLAKDALDSIIAVINGKADAVIENFAVINYLLLKNSLSIKYVKVLSDPMMLSSLHIATHKDNILLKDIIQKGIDSVTDEEKTELQLKWLGKTNIQKKSIYTQEEQEYLQNNKTITMCNNNNWEPISFQDSEQSNKLRGISIDTLSIIEEKLNIKFKHIPTSSWKEAQEYFQNKKCDILPAAIKTSNREKYANFTKPFLNLPLAIFTAKNKPLTNSLSELSDKSWSREKGSGLITTIKKEYPQTKVTETSGIKESLELVNNNKVYFTIATLPVASSIMMKYQFNNIQISGYPNIIYKLAIAVQKDNMMLLNILDKALGQITPKQHNDILKSWSNTSIEYPYINSSLIIKILLFLAVIAIFIFYRQYLLKKSNENLQMLVDNKTQELQELNTSLEHKIAKAIVEKRKQDKILDNQSKMVSMGEMIGNIAHQWRQPLSVISTGVTGMQVQKEYGLLTDEQFNKTCEMINENAQYLSKTIDDFKNFIRGDRIKQMFNLKDTIDTFIHLVEGTIKNKNIKIIIDTQETLKINGYENELIQCFINIFNNAKDALDEKKIETKLIKISTFLKNDKVIIKIQDNGLGIDPKIMDKIFEPYYTTKHMSQGTGLGLHMTYKLIVDGMHGTIIASNHNFKYENISYEGALFTITLPIK